MNLLDCLTCDTLVRSRSKLFSLLMCLIGTAFSLHAGDTPSPRIDYALAYFPRAGGVVMHGGWGRPDWNPLGEMWKLDASGWTQITVPGTPAMAHHAMTYDAARQKLVLCGTDFSAGSVQTVWTFDGATWLAQTNFPGFVAGDCELAYDSDRQRVVLYWAQDPYSGGTNQETWESDGTTWVKMNPAQKPARCSDGALLKYDEALHRTVLVAFPDFTDTSVQTWTWDGTNWAQVTGTQPTRGYPGSMAYDQARKQLILLATDLQTWSFDGSNWTQLSSVHSPAYYSMGYFALEYDPLRQVSWFFSGEGRVTAGGDLTYPEAVWQWNGVDWQVFGASAPAYQLTIAPLNGAMSISWPADATGYVLEASDSVTTNWLPVSNTPVLVGNQFVVTNPVAGTAQFFRLRKP